MRTLLRRWFGLRCAVMMCGCWPEHVNGLLVVRCQDCKSIRLVLS